MLKGFWNVLQHIKLISQCIFGCIKISKKPFWSTFSVVFQTRQSECCSLTTCCRLQWWACNYHPLRADGKRRGSENSCRCVVSAVVCLHLTVKVKERQRQRPYVQACFSGLSETELKGVIWHWWWGSISLPVYLFSFFICTTCSSLLPWSLIFIPLLQEVWEPPSGP